MSERGRRTDRLAVVIVLTAVLLGIGGGLLVVALVVRDM
jgi:hypothetical protein